MIYKVILTSQYRDIRFAVFVEGTDARTGRQTAIKMAEDWVADYLDDIIEVTTARVMYDNEPLTARQATYLLSCQIVCLETANNRS